MGEVRPVDTVPAIGISYKIIPDPDGRREIVFQTHLPADVPVGEINMVLDKMAAASQRQAAISEVIRLKSEVEENTLKVAHFRDEVLRLDEDSQAKWEAQEHRQPWDPKKLPPQERTARFNMVQNIDLTEKAVKQARAKIVELEKVIAGNAAPGTANR